jgi:glycine/D-amino acid oxidase-like deaminating enzyme/nitrite reductase/ring-hydroxylating ferredoxin subunit
MKIESGATTSLWMATGDVPSYGPLQDDATAEVCIVGAGITGITTAYLLSRAGKQVIVLDDGPVAGGETSRTTAHLTNAIDDRFFELERMHGEHGARIAAASHGAAIDRIEAIVREEAIDCSFERVDGYLFLGKDDKEEDLARELEAAHRAGLTSVEPLDRIPKVPFDSGPCLHFPRQAQFHPLKYIAALARSVTRSGGRIYTGSHVAEFEAKPRRPQVTTSDKKTVTADAVVFATNSPINDWVKMHTKQAAYRTFVIASHIPKGSVARGLYWDTADPYHYVRLHDGPDGLDMLIVGGEDHKTGQEDDAPDRFGHLEAWARARFPMMQTIDFRWSGQVMEPVDYLGFIGHDPGNDAKNVYIATGDSGQGMTHGTIAGILLTDLIVGRGNSWATLYDPSRISVKAAKEFAKENLNVAAQYRDYVTPGEVSAPDEVPRGQGAIIRRGTHKIAVYRDLDGTVHERSAVCTHLYCIVDWNSTEKSWDCPCHGSRFDPFGKVLNGPAVAPLNEVEKPE